MRTFNKLFLKDWNFKDVFDLLKEEDTQHLSVLYKTGAHFQYSNLKRLNIRSGNINKNVLNKRSLLSSIFSGVPLL